MKRFKRTLARFRGRLLTLLGRREAAIRAYRDGLDADPGHVPTLRTLGRLELARERWGEAEAWLVLAAELDPTDPQTWINLGLARGKSASDEGAVQAFRRALAMDSENTRAWRELGKLNAARGVHREAAEALEEAAKRLPRDAQVWYELGMAWHRSGETDRADRVIANLRRLDSSLAQRLLRDTGHSDTE